MIFYLGIIIILLTVISYLFKITWTSTIEEIKEVYKKCKVLEDRIKESELALLNIANLLDDWEKDVDGNFRGLKRLLSKVLDKNYNVLVELSNSLGQITRDLDTQQDMIELIIDQMHLDYDDGMEE